VGQGQGSVEKSPAREALERGDHAEAARLGGDPDVTAYLRPDRAAIVLGVLCFLLFVPIAVYYLAIR
jgi:hypothetical protein